MIWEPGSALAGWTFGLSADLTSWYEMGKSTACNLTSSVIAKKIN